jgi:hypothetical protein
MVTMHEPLTRENFPECLQRYFPEHVPTIRGVRRRNHTAAVTADMLTGEVFIDKIFVAGVERGDEESLARWFEIVEGVLRGPDELLQRIFQEYVEPVVLSSDRRARSTQGVAGPLLKARLDAAVGVSWRRQVGGFGPDELPRELLVAAYLYRGEILLHCRRRDRSRTALPTTEPFARVPAGVGARSVGRTVGEMLGYLLRVVDDDPRHQNDEFLTFAGVTDWLPFYAESLTVDIEGTVDTYAVGVWLPRSEYRSSRPGEPWAVADWRDAAELGATVLAAFESTTGASG